MKMIVKGFKFGMLLQLAVGPMCLLVFNTAASHGFMVALSLVIAITLIDFLYIMLSGLGVSAIIEKETIKSKIKVVGAVILMIFGLNMVVGAFDISLLPDIKLFSSVNGNSMFVQGLLLTASNPLTIIFWSGVFSTQIIENRYNNNQIRWLAVGCVLSTLFFLTFVAVLGTLANGFLSAQVMQLLNICVGCVIIFFGVKLLLKGTN